MSLLWVNFRAALDAAGGVRLRTALPRLAVLQAAPRLLAEFWK
jgi:hypothetical protein